ncbi:hypothetical protein PMG11_00154 [Penicillium brasilianum]|uniref:Zn(2)-C6 fungal-type domain-containing protein n=1 Tax=Penicillium brasilianum TaxID=104259 RepID=A0A0F7TFQ1_PENBI|nr:hypothetical protein PMG11_00154 [Penicillium brasilianum]
MATSSERPMTRQQAHIPPTAACEACRKLKMRCIRPNASSSTKEPDEPCDRCRRTNRACNIPTPRPLGRKRGAVGRYHGFEKAYRKMQAELKKARASTDKASEIQSLSPGRDESEMLDLLRSNIHKIDRGNGDWELPAESRRPGHQNPLSPSSSTINASGLPASEQNQSPYVTTPYAPETITSHVSLEPVSNPLALMAEAASAAQALETQVGPTDLSPASNFESISGDGEGIGRYLLHRPGYVSLGLHLDRKVLESGIDALFAPAMESDRYSNYFRSPGANPPRDIGPDLDPVDLGLVSMEEAYALFPVYFSRLHLINGILDPMLHTPGYVRSRSSLLFTWILALTAQFDHASGNLAKRLRLHGEKLSRHVHTCGYKTVEVVQGYYISLLSATPANTLSEERSWLYTMYAFGVAAELGLDQQRRTRYQKESDSCDTQNRSPEGTHSQRLLTFGQRSAVSIQENPETSDGPLLEDQTYLQRLARNRERTWLRILLWERANSAACGRINAFPETELTCNIENWWMHPLADLTDKHTCAFILLRRHLATLQSEIRRQASIPHSNPHWVRDLVDTDFGPWQATWLPSPNTILPHPEKLPDLYLYYVYIHNRLWTLSSALNISANNDRELDAIREDCFDAAIHCCEVAVRDLPVIGEPMYCMLSPTWAMISYAAVLALKLFPYLHGSRAGYEVELLALLAQVALQLKRAGTTPSHQVGIAALLGQHLLVILRARASMLKDAVLTPGEPFAPQHNNGTNHDPGCHLGGNLPNSTASRETLSGTRVNNALVSTYDPLLTTATTSTDTDLGEEGFTDLLREIFGPGFGDVF